MAVRREDYPPDWQLGICQRIMCEMVGYRCEHCGALFNKDRKALEIENADGRPAILTVHHLNGIPDDCHWRNLLVVCQSCHLSIQSKWQPGDPIPAEWNPIPNWLIIRDLTYKVQLALFPEKIRFE